MQWYVHVLFLIYYAYTSRFQDLIFACTNLDLQHPHLKVNFLYVCMFVYVLFVKLLVHTHTPNGFELFSCMHNSWNIGLHHQKLEANFRYACICGDSYTFCFSDVCLTHMHQGVKFFYAYTNLEPSICLVPTLKSTLDMYKWWFVYVLFLMCLLNA